MIDNEKKLHILQIIANNSVEREYFFNKLSNANNPSDWLDDLDKEGYLHPKNNPAPIEIIDQKGHYKIPQWEVLGFMLNVAEKNSINNDKAVTIKVQRFIESIIDYNNTSDSVDNFRTDYVILQIISLLPFDSIKIEYIQYISKALNTKWSNSTIVNIIIDKITPYLLRNSPGSNEFLKLVVSYMLRYREHKQTEYPFEYTSLIEEYWLQEFMKKYGKEIAKKLKIYGANIVESIIREIIEKDSAQFNIIWIPSIDNGPTFRSQDRYEYQIICFLRDCLLEVDSNILKKKITGYLQEEHPIFKRLWIHVIDKRYNDLNKLFWINKDNPLEYPTIKHELFCFFKNHALEFSELEITRILEWIENKDYDYLDKNEETKNNREKIISYKKKEWLYSLLGSRNYKVESLFDKYDTLNNSHLDHPGLDYWIEDFSFDEHQNTISTEYSNMTNEEIVQYLERKTTGNKRLNYGNIEDYGESIKKFVQNNPDKIWGNIKPFENLDPYYIFEILHAFIELWKNDNEINWKIIFEFITNIIEKIDYERVYTEDEFAYRDWVIGSIAELIEEGSSNDNHTFEAELLPISKSILLKLEANTVSKYVFTLDLATSILNSTRGKIYSAIINYSLRYARLYNKDKQVHFDPDIKELFIKRLNEAKNTEFFYSLGKYFRNILYLDSEWVRSNINTIYPKSDNELWEIVISGYLFFNPNINKEIYLLLKENYLKAINFNLNERQLNARVIHQICIAYLNGWELFQDADSNITKVLAQRKPNQIKEIINFIWIQKDSIKELSLINKIENLIIELYNIIAQLDASNDKNDLLSDLSQWIVFINQFNCEQFKVFSELAKYASLRFYSTEFIEELNRIADKSPSEVAEILIIEIRNKQQYPYYKEEIISKILDKLQHNKKVDQIIQICNLLIQKGLHEYKVLLKKYTTEQN
jgi:hypothetical protein